MDSINTLKRRHEYLSERYGESYTFGSDKSWECEMLLDKLRDIESAFRVLGSNVQTYSTDDKYPNLYPKTKLNTREEVITHLKEYMGDRHPEDIYYEGEMLMVDECDDADWVFDFVSKFTNWEGDEDK